MAVYKRKDGHWRVVIKYKSASGENCRYYESTKTRKEAIKREAELINKLSGLPDKDIVFSELTERFLSSCQESKKLSTIT
ncbi:MAG: hypothetical protein K6G09_01575, partial [Treponema sp.]|nr:hypothetical protein [Treponema sp.]